MSFKVGDVVNHKKMNSKYTVKYVSKTPGTAAYVFESHLDGKDYGISKHEEQFYELWSVDSQYEVGTVLESVTDIPGRLTRYLYIKLDRDCWLSISVQKASDDGRLYPQRLTYEGMKSRAGTKLVKVT